MKMQSLIRKTVLVVLCSLAVVSYAQVFPDFEEVTSDELPMVFRGSAIWGDYDNDDTYEAFVVGRKPQDWAVHGFVLKPNANMEIEMMSDLQIMGFPSFDGENNEVYNTILQWIDYDNDGLLDLLFMGNVYDENRPNPSDNNPDRTDNYYALFFDLYRNTGAGFEKVSDTGLEGLYVEEESNYASVVSVGDYDNDGYMDIIVTGIRDRVRRVDLYKNDGGTGRFILQDAPVRGVDGMESFAPQNAGSVTFADFNNDGYLDIIVNGWNDDANNALVMMYLNNGDGTFRDNMINYDIEDAGSKSQIGVADINGDGYLDFVLSGEYLAGKDDWRKSSSIYYFDQEDYGYAMYRYAAGSDVGLGSFQKSAIDFADFNSDGKLDFVIAGEVGNGIPRTTIFMQEDDGIFDSLDGDDLVGSVRSGAIVTLADYDGDGYLDAMSMGYNNLTTGGREGLHFGIFRNLGNLPKNELPTSPTNLNAEFVDGIAVFNWDAGTDKETPVSALRYNFYLKKPNGEEYMIIPANIETGFLKTTNNHVTALGTTTYRMNLPQGEYEWGVQTIDQSKAGSSFTFSTFVTGVEDIILPQIKTSVIDGKIFITTDEETKVMLYDVNATCMLEKTINSSTYLHESAVFEKGIYILKIQVGNQIKNTKVVL